MHILQVGTRDLGGGAEKIAYDLHEAYLRRGNESHLAVGFQHRDGSSAADRRIVEITGSRGETAWQKFWTALGRPFLKHSGAGWGAGRIHRLLAHQIGRFPAWRDERRGREDFYHPRSRRLLNLVPGAPDVLHCHNLHGSYFDLRILPELSRKLPLFVTLHDEWMLTGHCAYTVDCERWKIGCGECPYLDHYPALQVDGTKENFAIKKDIYARSQLRVAAPSQWLVDEVRASGIMGEPVDLRVIRNGIDLNVFQPPADREFERRRLAKELGLDEQAPVLVFTANGVRRNIWKDFATLRDAIARTAEQIGGSINFVAVGEDCPDEHIGAATIRFVPYEKDPRSVARYYQAADLYLHAARADNFPTTILEALACGAPAVATAVGGIPETFVDQESGLLTPGGDANAMAQAIVGLLHDGERRQRMSASAARYAKRHYDRERMVDDYLAWYRSALS